MNQGNKPFMSALTAIWAKEPVQGALLQNARIELLGERAFVVGQVPDDGTADVRIGLTFWFAVDDVLMITEFREMKEARTYFAERSKWESASKAKGGGAHS